MGPRPTSTLLMAETTPIARSSLALTADLGVAPPLT